VVHDVEVPDCCSIRKLLAPGEVFKVEPGTFDILVGDSSDDILLRGHLDVTPREAKRAVNRIGRRR
jgi:hypothetical protein